MSTLVPISHNERLANVCVLKEQPTEDAYWMDAVLYERIRDREGSGPSTRKRKRGQRNENHRDRPKVR